MWKRLKTPGTVVVVIVLVFAVVIGRGYYRSRMRDALVRELKEARLEVNWRYVGPPWLERFLPGGIRFHRQVISHFYLGDDALLARVVDYLPNVLSLQGDHHSVVTDAPLRRVAQLDGLHLLDLSRTKVPAFDAPEELGGGVAIFSGSTHLVGYA